MDELSPESYRANRLLRKLSKKKFQRKVEPFHKVQLSKESYQKLEIHLKENTNPPEKPLKSNVKSQKPNKFVSFQKEWNAMKWVRSASRSNLKPPGEIPRLTKEWRWAEDDEEG